MSDTQEVPNVIQNLAYTRDSGAIRIMISTAFYNVDSWRSGKKSIVPLCSIESVMQAQAKDPGQKICEMRMAVGLSQDALAFACQMDRS